MEESHISHYKILKKLGEGGMGVVYKAEDTRLKRTVALKFLSKEFVRNREARERFEREAQAAAALNNPHIVTIHEIDEHEGQIYIAMEYVEGQSLNDVISNVLDQYDTPFESDISLKTPKTAPPAISPTLIGTEQAIELAIQICEGLKAAHQSGIVHRDIKSQNILINKEGVVKILDFGVAKLKGGTRITKESTAIGTPQYMAPEQLRGKEIDPRTDIWSLGVLLYEMLTLQLPFDEENLLATMNAIINEDPIHPSELNDDIPRDLEEIILKCLRKEKEERYPSVEQLIWNLSRVKRALKRKAHKDEVGMEQQEPPPARKESERRRATVLYAEITAYQEMLERMDEEEVATVMSDCFNMFGQVVRKYEGRLEKITGNSFMVLFGVPSAVENAPEKAVNTAIEIRNKLAQCNRKESQKIPLDIRIGINTGMVIAGVMGQENGKYSVIGDTVTMAHQLKDAAAKAQILITSATYKFTKNGFEYKELKPIPLKGKNKTAAVYELLSTKERIGQPRLGSERMIFSEMVGRDKELDKLQLQLLKVINGEGSIVNVIGEAGIGKSRLIAEFKGTDALKKVTLIKGRALSIGRNLSFHPLIDALKNWAGIKEDDSGEESFTKLEAAVRSTYAQGAEEILPFISTLMGMKLDGKFAERLEGIEGEAMEKLIKKNFRELILKAAEQKPLVFMIEDVHWADLTSIELLESLFRLAENNPILFINVFRPEYHETSERLLKTIQERYRRFHTEIYLESLGESHSGHLISSLLKTKGLPTNIVKLITKRAGGNPFFIEEVMRSFIDDSVVEFRDGQFKVTEKIDSVVIPETINAVLMGRIDKLDEETRSLMKIASVIGKNFFYKILAEVGKNIDEIDDKLEFLKEVQLIQEIKRRRIAELEYIFKHALVQEVAYESILHKKRKELHARVAAAIELVFAEKLREFYGMLALHYSLGEDVEKAENYLIKAGEEALKAAASSEALHYYQEALKLYLKKHGESGDPDTIANLEKKIAVAFYNKGYLIEAVEHFDKVLELWGEKLVKGKIKVLLNLVVNLLSIIKTLYLPIRKAKKTPHPRINDIVDITHKRGTALATVDNYRMFVDSVGLLRKLNKLDLSKVAKGASMYIQGSSLFSFSGVSFRISKKLLEYPREYISSGGQKAFIDYKFGQLMHGILSGDWCDELACDDEVVEGSVKMGELWTSIAYLLWSGKFLIERGNFPEAQKCVDKLHEIGEVYDHDYARARKHSLRTRLLLKTRNLSEALSDADAGISYSTSVGQNLNLLNHTGIKANIQILQGDMAGANESLRQARELAAQESRIAPWHISSYHLSEFLHDIYNLEKNLKSGDKAKIDQFRKQARRSGKAALKTANKYAPNLTETLKLMGVYYWILGKQKQALTWWAKSISTGEQLQALPELGRTYLEIGKRLLSKESKPRDLKGVTPAEYLEKSRAIFEKTCLLKDLDDLEKVK